MLRQLREGAAQLREQALKEAREVRRSLRTADAGDTQASERAAAE